MIDPQVPDEHIVIEVLTERYNQHEKWGEQSHPMIADVTDEAVADGHAYFGEMADRYKALNARSAAEGRLDWAGILLEEVYEALAEVDPEHQRAELVQVAAVAVAAIEAIDRREAQ
jgi:hypothetical protein